MATKSTKPHRNGKPRKPYPGFPLFAHATRRWAKKIRQRIHYFGSWDDPDAALQKYLDQRDDLHAGRTPRVDQDGLTIRDLANRFLTSKKHLLDNGEITVRTFRDYFQTCEQVIGAFDANRLVDDLASDDFERLRASLAKTRGPVTLGNEVQRVRTLFKYGYDAGLIDRPIRFGPTFKKPSKRLLRQARHRNGRRMYEADELRLLLDAASPTLRAMILLGINCGFGQSDISSLPMASIDLASRWVEFPRPKTAVERRCPLWPETAEAVSTAMKDRPNPRDTSDADLAFITRQGRRWVRISDGEKQSWIDAIGLQFGKLLRSLDLKRPGLNFYALRHTFETIAGESADQVAVDHIMGHARDDMASRYRQRISDERLQRVVETVRGWLWPPGGHSDLTSPSSTAKSAVPAHQRFA